MNVEPGVEIISAACPNCRQVRVYLGTRWHQLQCKDCGQPFAPPLTIATHLFKPSAAQSRPSTSI